MRKGVSLISGIGLGAGLMYWLDPDRGNRRRALVRDKLVHAFHSTGNAIDRTSHYLTNRARGLAAEAGSRLRCEPVSDEVLVERVRSKLGRLVSHPRAIDVTAHQGCVTLSGPILASEVRRMLCRISSVRGVTDVVNRLEVHEQSDEVPALQGGAARPSSG